MKYKLSPDPEEPKILRAVDSKTGELAFVIHEGHLDPFIRAHLLSYDYIEIELIMV